MIGAIILGIVAGFIGKAIVPGDDPGGFFATIGIGLVGAIIGWLVFTAGLGIGDTDVFDLGGLLSAIIGVVILLVGYRVVVGRRASA
ncbi:MAG: GlsB/YeaQ/YmgE family stress response membrane protein [Solirubrobacteraceae bacterium]